MRRLNWQAHQSIVVVPVIVPGTWSQCLGHRHSAWDSDTVSSLDRYLLGSYGLRYNRDRSRVNISSEHPHKSSTPSTPHPSIFRFANIRNQLLLQNQISVFLSLFSGQGVLKWLADLSAFTRDHSLKFCCALSPVSGTKSYENVSSSVWPSLVLGSITWVWHRTQYCTYVY
jgi:hypothetical protein